mgnify:CR=1 FL=1|jgi:hypothetical protein
MLLVCAMLLPTVAAHGLSDWWHGTHSCFEVGYHFDDTTLVVMRRQVHRPVLVADQAIGDGDDRPMPDDGFAIYDLRLGQTEPGTTDEIDGAWHIRTTTLPALPPQEAIESETYSLVDGVGEKLVFGGPYFKTTVMEGGLTTPSTQEFPVLGGTGKFKHVRSATVTYGDAPDYLRTIKLCP